MGWLWHSGGGRSRLRRLVLTVLAAVFGVLVWTGLAGGTQPYDTYQSAVAADGPVAQYRFDDPAGSTTLADAAGTDTGSNSGIVLGGAGPFPGSSSGSFGGTAFASLSSNPLAGATAWSAEGWVYWTGGASYKQPIFDFGSSSTNYMYLTPASGLTGHTLLFEIRTTAGTVGQVTAPMPMAKDWEYVTVTETSSGTLTLYLNGVQVGQTTGVTITPSSLGSTPNDWLGKSQVSADPMFHGSLSNVAFYTKALSASQVAAHFDAAEYPVNSSLPAISGTAKDGQTLTATAGTWTGLAPITFAYQWTLCEASGSGCANIASATKTTYKATPEDVGRTLRIAVTGKNSAGSSSATSNQTATIAPLAPANTKLPAISGTAKDGQVLTVSNGTWTGTPPLSYVYQWEACNSSGAACSSIPGATASTYRVITSQIGATLRAVVTASNAGGSASATSAASAVIAAGLPVNTALPEISGTAMEGQTLSASTGTWTGTAPFTYTYQWEKCNSSGASCANLAGATSATYVLGSSNLGTTLRVIVTAKNASGSAKATSPATAVVVAKAPVNTAPPVISGTAQDGQTLSASSGSWTGITPFSYTYQWQRCNSTGESCSNISGATSSTYLLGHSDVGTTLRVTVTAKNTAGSASASSTATQVVAALAPSNTAVPVISGTATDGQTLSASTGTWVGTPPISYTYQWQACNTSGESCSNISGATSSTYVLGHGDVGTTLRVTVTASNTAGLASAGSAPSATVTALAPSNSTAPTITGTAQDGQTLTASTGSWTGTPPISYAHQWQTCNSLGESCTNISGATGSTYSLGHGDVGTTVRVSVTASNTGGSASASSVVSAVVSALAPSNTAPPTITGTATDGQTLTASTGMWSGTPPLTYAYQWESCNSLGEGCLGISGATSSTYVLGHGDVGTTLRVTVTASNTAGSASASSTATQVVTALVPSNTTAPAISGTATDGQTLSASTDAWAGTPPLSYAYQWQTCNSAGESCTNISGATSSTYQLSAANVGSTLRVVLTASNTAGSASSTSEATAVVTALAPSNTAVPVITGTAQDGQTLSASTGAWTGTPPLSYAYQWQSCNTSGEGCSNISGATGSTYVLGHGDVGTSLRVTVTASNTAGSASSTSEATAVAVALAPANTMAPAITGTTTSGQTLSASTGTWDGTPPLTYTYQWESCNSLGEGCLAIAGATASSYTLGPSDVGNTVRIVVTATNSAGSASATSAATAVVSSGSGSGGPLVYTAQFGSQGSGNGQFNHPGDIAIDSAGHLFVLDRGNGRVEVFTEAGEFLRQFGSVGSGAGQLSSPDGLALDSKNDVWVVDTGHGRVEEFNATGEFVKAVGAGQIGSAEGIAVDRHDDVWVAETYQGRLGVFSNEGVRLKTVASRGSGAGQLGEPEGLAVDPEGHVWVADWSNNRVEEFNETGEYMKQFGVAGSGEGQIRAPYGIAVGSAGAVFVGEVGNHRVQQFNEGGEYVSQLGSSGSGPGQLSLSYPIGLAVSNEDVWVTDSGNNRVEEWAPEASVAPSNTSSPSISGEPFEGQTLGASRGSWRGTPPLSYGYQWQRCNSSGGECADIAGATGQSYTLGSVDLGATIRVVVTASNSLGAASASSSPTAVVSPPTPPSNTTPPAISGTARAGWRLRASTGTWSGTPPLTYAYQWESCNSLGEGCLAIGGANASSYLLGPSDVETTLRVAVTASNSVGSASASSAPTAVVMSGTAGCTDTWTGEAGDGSWQTAGNWSTGSVPTNSDQVCIPLGATVNVIGGTNTVGSIIGEGGLVISGGSLALTNSSQASSVSSLSLSNATLSGPSTLDVTSSFTLGANATMSGSGATVLQSGVTGEIYSSNGCAPMSLTARQLVNEGTLTFGWGTLFISAGARFENKGTFKDNSEASCEGPQIQNFFRSGPFSILNTGQFQKTGGSGTSTVAVSFGNQGTVQAQTGQLKFSDGGIPEEVATGSWAVQGAGSIVLSGGTFLIAEEVDLSAVQIQGATVTRVRLGPPMSSASPSISGEPYEGQTLSASTGTWTGTPPLSYSYQWQSCNSGGGECANIAGATSNSYTLGNSDVGRTVHVLVTATNTLGSATAASQPTAVIATPIPPSNTTPPAISGTEQDGQTLSASTGTWTGAPPPSYSYQWESCESAGAGCSDISGATNSTFVLEHGAVGTTLRVRIQATSFAGSASSTSEATALVVPLAPSNATPPVISGTAQDGQTLSAGPGTWNGTPPLSYSYQWLTCNSLGVSCMNIPGATTETYVPGGGDVGNTLQVMVTATNSTGSASSFSTVTAAVLPPPPSNTVPPVVTGTVQVGQALSANTGTWEGAPPITYSYQWQECFTYRETCTNIPGATSATYTPVGVDAGSPLQVVVTATNPGGPTSSGSEATDVVAGRSGESACTDTWIGPSNEFWEEASDWSTGTVPTASDVACIGSGPNVIVNQGTNQVGVLRDEGELTLYQGLEVTNTSEVSTVRRLKLFGVLTGPGSLEVSSYLDWRFGGKMSGSGQTVVGPAATGTFEGSPLLAGRTLVNEGTLPFLNALLFMSEGALLENKGTFIDNSETCAQNCLGIPGEILPSGSGATPRILNTGTFEKTAGSGISTVAVPFSNEGIVSVQSGELKFIDGGIPEQVAAGSWSVENGASIVLGGGNFLIGEGVDLSAVSIEGATVTRGPVLAPSSSSPPSISGQPIAGQTLSVNTGTWSGTLPLSYGYQWQRCNSSGGECTNITGATSSGYALGGGDVGTTLRVLVTASNAGGTGNATSTPTSVITAATSPSNTTLPAVSGTPQDGQTLTASTGSWSGPGPITYSYQWESCNSSGGECAAIEGVTGTKYQVGEGDINTTVRVVVTATNSLGSAQAISPATLVVQPEPPSELEARSISGTPDAHQVLQADAGVWAGTATEISYQWESCNSSGGECAAIEGATNAEYDLGGGDVGTKLRVRIGAGNIRDSLTDVSSATPVIGADSALANTSVPSISGAPQSGQVLTVEPGTWSATGTVTYTYQWQSCNRYGSGCEVIEGATNSSYTPVSGNGGSSLRVLVTATDERGSLSQVSPATQPVVATQAPVIKEPPVISGTALQGDTLTATTGTWSGERTITYSYQWNRCSQSGQCAAIEGATASSYTLTASDVNSTVLVLVSATDAGGGSTGISTPTAVIGPESIVKYAAPSISGTVQVGGTLSANPGIWSASGPVSYAYQWESCNPSGGECAAIQVANEPSYIISSGDLGSTLQVMVTVTNPLGSTSALSAHTAVTPNGEATVTQAIEVAQHADPSLLAPSTSASLEEQTVSPALSDGEEQISATGTLTSSTISKETPGEFAINTPEGELSLTPVDTSPNATTTPTIVNGAAALFANTWPATDTIVRPDAFGATTLLQLRSAEAPTSFSWEVGLGANQELRQLPDGSIAVTDPTEAPPELAAAEEAEIEAESESETPQEPESESEAEAEGEPQAEAAEEPEHFAEEVALESLSTAPLSSTPLVEPIPGQLHPQNTQTNSESAAAAVASAETQTAGNTLMVIEAPTVKDANGNSVPASLSATGNTITLTLQPSSSTIYPVLVDPTAAS